MLWKKDDPNRNRRLDRLGRTLIRASQAGDEEIETAVSSPALLERIRARASAGASRPSGTADDWALDKWALNKWVLDDWAADILAAPRAIAWRAIPALSLVAAVALALWLNAAGGQAENSFTNSDAVAGVEIIQSDPAAPATACSVATKEECAVSTDDAVAILVSATAKETNR